jgi:hypothetical protein
MFLHNTLLLYSLSPYSQTERLTESQKQLLAVCCVSFWFWREIGFGLHTHVLRVQYSCGGVLVFWLWRQIVFGVMYILSVQYSCAVVSVFWL